MPWKPDEERLRLRVQAELQRVRVQERERLASLYDWYGLSCPCGLPPGDCEVHPRARLKQRPPGTPGSPWPADYPWSVFLMQAGRGGGKTRAAAEFVRWKIEIGQWKDVIIVGATIGEVIKYQVKGPSGLETISPPWNPARYIPSQSRIYYPVHNASVYLATSEKPKSLRGGNIDGAWSDEAGKWENQEDMWHQIEWVLRNKTTPPPQNIVSTTSTASPVMDRLNDEADREEESPGSTGVLRVEWDTTENANHLDPTWLARREEQWRGTLQGQQEMGGKHLRRREGALWGPESFDGQGFRLAETPEMVYIGVAVDPSSGSKRAAASESGIIVGGRMPETRGSLLSHAAILDDRTTTGKPSDWGEAVVRAYHDWGANEVIAEANQGGEMVRHVIETVPAKGGYPSGRNIPIVLVHASVGKTARAEPIQALYESGRVHHLRGLDRLEAQMLRYLPGRPGQLLDRVDALVWLLKKCIIDHDSGGDSGPLFHGLAREPFQYLGDFDWSSH
jgi:phage terminase large subunit-like protein